MPKRKDVGEGGLRGYVWTYDSRCLLSHKAYFVWVSPQIQSKPRYEGKEAPCRPYKVSGKSPCFPWCLCPPGWISRSRLKRGAYIGNGRLCYTSLMRATPPLAPQSLGSGRQWAGLEGKNRKPILKEVLGAKTEKWAQARASLRRGNSWNWNRHYYDHNTR